MRLRTGTSGFSYKGWKGSFYPEGLADREMLRYYAQELSTVEINNTFYRMPRPELIERWRDQVEDDFTFVIKASQRITHRARLSGTEELVEYLWTSVQALGPTLGPLLFQLPPNFRCDLERLKTFLASLPEGCRAVLEFRHESWFEDGVYDVLRERGAALCLADTEEGPEPPLVPTAEWGYLRLRRPDYDDAALAVWAERIRAQPWKEAFVFFKHEDEGAAPRMAQSLARLANGQADG